MTCPAGSEGWPSRARRVEAAPGHGPSPRGGAVALVMGRVNGKGLFPSKGKTKLAPESFPALLNSPF